MKFCLPISIFSVSLALVGCSSAPSASNYGQYMNDPAVHHGASADIASQLANKAAWKNIKVTQMTSVRKLPNGDYATGPSAGVLTVRAVLVNAGDKPAQGNWRCRFYDSNNLPLYEAVSNQTASGPNALGWHQMVVYPVTSKTQTADANVIHCQAANSLAVTAHIEFHDTSNDITVYHR